MFCMQYAFPTKCVLYAICFPELHYIIFFYLGICRTSSSMAHVGILSRNDAMLKRLQLWVANMITAWAHHLPNDFFLVWETVHIHQSMNSEYHPVPLSFSTSQEMRILSINWRCQLDPWLFCIGGALVETVATHCWSKSLACDVMFFESVKLWFAIQGCFDKNKWLMFETLECFLHFFQLAIVLLCHKQFPMTLHDSSVHTNYMHLCCCKNKIACLLRYILILSYGWQTAYNSKEQLAWPWMVEMY